MNKKRVSKEGSNKDLSTFSKIAILVELALLVGVGYSFWIILFFIPPDAVGVVLAAFGVTCFCVMMLMEVEYQRRRVKL